MLQSNTYFTGTTEVFGNLGLPSLILLCLLAFMLVRLRLRPARRRKWYSKPDRFTPKSGPQLVPARANLKDPMAQMDVIARVAFETTPLLNREEARLLPVLEAAVRDFGQGHRLMAQTSLGEILRPRDGSGTQDQMRDAYASINSKRLDFAIFDRWGHLRAAIEYQGSGHFSSQNSFMRDAVKREAVRKAGVPYIEIPNNFDAADVRNRIQHILRPVSASN